MKVKATLSQLISDFAGMSKTPLTPKRDGSVSPVREPSPKAPSQRRHSLNITVGATELPRSKTRRNSISVSGSEEEEMPKYDINKRRQSAPCLRGSLDRSAELKKKLENLKLKKTHSDDDIQEEEEE